jgi:predicted nucleotidyltransferase
MVALGEVVERLVHALEPERIYLFGSRARADAHADSDYDLLVVVSSSEEPGYRRDQDARRVLGDVSLPLDVLISSENELRRPAPWA